MTNAISASLRKADLLGLGGAVAVRMPSGTLPVDGAILLGILLGFTEAGPT